MNTETYYVELSHILGDKTTDAGSVALFNSCRPIEKDDQGQYIISATRPHKTGVMVKKQYL